LILTLWDIENVSFTYLKENFSDFIDNKYFIHNDKNIPIKENKRNFLLNNNWIYISVKPGKDSADFKIQSIIKNKIKIVEEINLITSDNGFSDIILFVIKNKIKINLYTKRSSDKLLNKIYNKFYVKNTENINQYLNIIYL